MAPNSKPTKVIGPRIIREKRTVAAMIELYCADHHQGQDALCPPCAELHEYALHRLERCPFQEGKTTCVQCAVHCYKPEMREQIRVVMRYAGPRMIWKHPLLAAHHLIDGRRKVAIAPEKPVR